MTVFTKSQFFYGHTITTDNRSLDFKEGSSNFNAFLRVGSYGLQEFALEFTRAMNLVSNNNYTSSVNRATRQITVTGDANFELLPVTGLNAGSTVLPLAGFEADTSASTSQQGDASGSVFEPLFQLQDFTPFNQDKNSVDAVINETASGRVEAVTYGLSRFMTCNIRYQTNKKIAGRQKDGSVLELEKFMDYLITKASVEFMPNVSDPDTYFLCLLESTQRSGQGVGYKLTESDGVPGFFDSGRMVFRERIV